MRRSWLPTLSPDLIARTVPNIQRGERPCDDRDLDDVISGRIMRHMSETERATVQLCIIEHRSCAQVARFLSLASGIKIDRGQMRKSLAKCRRLIAAYLLLHSSASRRQLLAAGRRRLAQQRGRRLPPGLTAMLIARLPDTEIAHRSGISRETAAWARRDLSRERSPMRSEALAALARFLAQCRGSLRRRRRSWLTGEWEL